MHQHTPANTSHMIRAMGVATPAYSSACFFRPMPNRAAITVFTPTPVPTARAIISSWRG